MEDSKTFWRDSILFQTLKELRPNEYDALCEYEKAGNKLTEDEKVAKFLYEKYLKSYYQKKTTKETLKKFAESIDEEMETQNNNNNKTHKTNDILQFKQIN